MFDSGNARRSIAVPTLQESRADDDGFISSRFIFLSQDGCEVLLNLGVLVSMDRTVRLQLDGQDIPINGETGYNITREPRAKVRREVRDRSERG